MAKPQRSPSRGRQLDVPLSPCLVHRSQSSLERLPRQPMTRRPSLPLPPEHVAKLVTVPLRACCPDCLPATEECLKEGSRWEEKFTRGARRRRSSSASSDDFSIVTPSSSTGFTAVAANRHGRPEPAVITSRFQSALSITVDEVDKRRRSLEHVIEPSPIETTSSGSPVVPVRSLAIVEEDEDQLFPLPSPRRTPSNSPSNSTEASPAPSPNASRLGLNASHDSLAHNGSEEVLPKSLARRGRCEKGLLTPELPAAETAPCHVRSSSCPTTSSPVIPLHTRSTTSQPVESTTTSSPGHTKPRNPSFSPTTFFKEALKGVSAMGSSTGFS